MTCHTAAIAVNLLPRGCQTRVITERHFSGLFFPLQHKSLLRSPCRKGAFFVYFGGWLGHGAMPHFSCSSAGPTNFRRYSTRMNVYRIHIRPDGRAAAFSFAYCLEAGVLGMGWQVSAPSGSRLTWDDYQRLAAEGGGKRVPSQVQYLHDYVKPGDLIWTRNPDGCYYLARVLPPRSPDTQDGSAWEYLDTPQGREADVLNVVRCHILPVRQPDDVPGKVIACFRARRTIQAIADETSVLYSKWLWSQLSGDPFESDPACRVSDIFSLLGDESTEDVIFIFLQCQGWVVVPHSRKRDTMAYEFIAIHRDSFERAVVQAKTGSTRINFDNWRDRREKVFLFQSNGLYEGHPASNVITIQPAEIKAFIQEHLGLMPGSVRRWVEIVRRLDDASVNPGSPG